jgi:hypothetical protein
MRRNQFRKAASFKRSQARKAFRKKSLTSLLRAVLFQRIPSYMGQTTKSHCLAKWVINSSTSPRCHLIDQSTPSRARIRLSNTQRGQNRVQIGRWPVMAASTARRAKPVRHSPVGLSNNPCIVVSCYVASRVFIEIKSDPAM